MYFHKHMQHQNMYAQILHLHLVHKDAGVQAGRLRFPVVTEGTRETT